MTIHRRRGLAVACARADMEGTRRRRSRSRGVRLALLVVLPGPEERLDFVRLELLSGASCLPSMPAQAK